MVNNEFCSSDVESIDLDPGEVLSISQPVWNIAYVESGLACFSAGKLTEELPEGTVVMIRPEVTCSISASQSDAVKLHIFRFSFGQLDCVLSLPELEFFRLQEKRADKGPILLFSKEDVRAGRFREIVESRVSRGPTITRIQALTFAVEILEDGLLVQSGIS